MFLLGKIVRKILVCFSLRHPTPRETEMMAVTVNRYTQPPTHWGLPTVWDRPGNPEPLICL